MTFIKKLFKYGVLAGYIILTIVLIVEASLPGHISAGQSNAVGDIIVDVIEPDFEEDPIYINPTGLNIDIPLKDKYLVGESYRLITEVLPSDSSNKSIIYSTSDASVATVSNDGVLRLHKKGTVTITGTLKDTEFSDNFTINIEEILLDDFDIVCDTIMDTNHEYTVHVNFYPSNATNKNLTWKSSDTEIATINNSGHIVPKKAGFVTFTATSSNNVIKEVTVEIKLIVIEKIDVTNIEVNNSVLNLTEGMKEKINVTVLPDNASNKDLKFISNNPDVFTVDKYGNITCIKNGQGTLTMSSLSNPEVSIEISVIVSSKIAEFTITNVVDNNITIHTNDSVKLEIEESTMPVIYEYEFISENSDICDVTSDGVINGIKKGTTNIIVKCISGDGTIKEINFTVKVEKVVNYSAITNFYYIIRKGIGHFGAFLVLSIFATLVVLMFFKKKYLFALISLVVGFLTAGLTEFIQLFVPGRSGLFKDVMIDYVGYISGTIIVLLIYVIIKLIGRWKNGEKLS